METKERWQADIADYLVGTYGERPQGFRAQEKVFTFDDQLREAAQT